MGSWLGQQASHMRSKAYKSKSLQTLDYFLNFKTQSKNVWFKFWTLCGNSLSHKRGVFGKAGELQTVLCVCSWRGSVTFSGTMSGDVYKWRENNLERTIPHAHNVSWVVCINFNFILRRKLNSLIVFLLRMKR